MAKNTLRTAIAARVAGKAVDPSDLVKSAPGVSAVLSKLIRDESPRQHDENGNIQITGVDQGMMQTSSAHISEKADDAETTLQLFPEMELSKQVLVASIIAPKDMQTTELTFTASDDLKCAPLTAQLLEIIKKYFETDYKIEPRLTEILNEILFGSGSYAAAVIPENSVDELINGTRGISQESLGTYIDKDVFRATGWLGHGSGAKTSAVTTNFSVESFAAQGSTPITDYDHQVHFTTDKGLQILQHLKVTDNFNALKLPRIIERKRNQDAKMILARNSSVGLESLQVFGMEGNSTRINDAQLGNVFFKNPKLGVKNITKVKTDSELPRKTIGPALTMHLPSEAVMPVHVPGDVKKHVGFFVLLDMEGNPVSRKSKMSRFNDIRTGATTESMAHNLLGKASTINGVQCNIRSFDDAARVYSNIVEADLLARLRNGIVGPNVEISSNEDIYNIMMARALKQQNTQILYIPSELMTYYAYRYDDNGFGKSLLDDMQTINTLRAMLLFSGVMADVKNAVGRSRVKLKISENDPNPQKTVEIGMHEVMKARQRNYFPVGQTNNPGDIMRSISTAGVEFEFEGHPALPDTSVEFSETNSNYVKADSGLEEELRKRSIMAVGLPPETVDNGFSGDFATTAVASNLLLSKRVTQIQDAFVPLVTDNCRKVAINNGTLFEECKQLILENLGKLTDVVSADPELSTMKASVGDDALAHYLTIEFLSNFETNLSRPDVVTLENQMAAFDARLEAYTKAIDHYVSANIMPEAFGAEEVTSRIDEVKSMLISALMRRWMSQENILPELNEMIQLDADGKIEMGIGNEVQDHNSAMSKVVVDMLRRSKPIGVAASTDIANISGGEDLGESTATTSTPESSSSGDSSDTPPEDDTSGGGSDLPEDDGMNLPGLDDLG